MQRCILPVYLVSHVLGTRRDGRGEASLTYLRMNSGDLLQEFTAGILASESCIV